MLLRFHFLYNLLTADRQSNLSFGITGCISVDSFGNVKLSFDAGVIIILFTIGH